MAWHLLVVTLLVGIVQHFILSPGLTSAAPVAHITAAEQFMAQGLLPSHGAYAREWGIDARRVELLKPEGVVLHPGPMNREVEIASDVAGGTRSLVLRQVANGVAVRAAVLAWCVGRSES